MRTARINKVLAEGKAGDEITVYGWVKTKRVSKGFAFIVLSDGSSQDTLQLVVSEGTTAHKQLDKCNTGSAVRSHGILKESPGKGQKYELDAYELEVIGTSDPDKYPLQKKGHTLEFLREIGHLRPRSNTFGAVFRIRNLISDSIHRFLQDRGFLWVHTPIITSSDCEGAGDLFSVATSVKDSHKTDVPGGITYSDDFFGRRAYLTVSGQLEAEFLAMALSDVYTFGPTFRAENSNTSRHLSEFWMVEPEMAFADIDDIIALAEDLLRYLFSTVAAKAGKEIDFLYKYYKGISLDDIRYLSERSFTRISYSDAIGELAASKKEFEFPAHWGNDLQSEHERYLTEIVFKGPLIVTDYPINIKPFYMRANDDGKTVAAMDVLVPGVGEIIGGSQREERLDILRNRMAEAGVSEDNLQWYLDLRRYGSAPHAGFGLGLERLVQYLTGMHNIRDVIPCPRAPGTIKM